MCPRCLLCAVSSNHVISGISTATIYLAASFHISFLVVVSCVRLLTHHFYLKRMTGQLHDNMVFLSFFVTLRSVSSLDTSIMMHKSVDLKRSLRKHALLRVFTKTFSITWPFKEFFFFHSHRSESENYANLRVRKTRGILMKWRIFERAIIIHWNENILLNQFVITPINFTWQSARRFCFWRLIWNRAQNMPSKFNKVMKMTMEPPIRVGSNWQC